jgi:hypothetical protein
MRGTAALDSHVWLKKLFHLDSLLHDDAMTPGCYSKGAVYLLETSPPCLARTYAGHEARSADGLDPRAQFAIARENG